MMRNIYAMTEPGKQPGYLSINQLENGRVRFTVRSPGKDGDLGNQAEIEITPQQAVQMATAVATIKGD